MRDSLYLSWQYLRHHRVKTVVLIASVTLILYLPAALQVIVWNAEKHFRARAESTPLVLGPRGSSLELILGCVYFDKPCSEVLRSEQLQRVSSQRLGTAIPIHSRYSVRDCQVVGTSEDYFFLRGLHAGRGRMVQMHGECVIGAVVADRLELALGDKIPVSKSSAFVLDNPPIRLNVVGVLEATETPDDQAIFIDLETAWIIDGLGHGHSSGSKHGTPGAELRTDITSENVASFHFHGDRSKFPISAVIIAPDSVKSETILLGQYYSPDETAQIVRPKEVMDSLLARVVMIRSYMIAMIAVTSIVTLLMMGLVMVLSIRLRHSEIVTMSKMGCSRFAILSIVGGQLAIVLAASISIAALLTLITNSYGPDLVRMFVL